MPGIVVSALLIGRNPPSWFQNKLKSDKFVVFTGTVNDVYPWLNKVDILCLPLDQGAGTKLRVLEAMAVGLPIVGNSFAFSGIENILDGKNVLVADDDISFASRICELILNFDMRIRIGHEARKVVETSYDWNIIIKNLSENLKAIV